MTTSPNSPTSLVRFASPTDVLADVFVEAMRPDPLLTVSEWADAHRVLPARESEPGRWRTDRAPFLREIMDCLSVSSPVSRVALMKGAQLGGTECILNFEGYLIDCVPATVLHVVPTAEDIKKVSRRRVAPMIEECPRLKSRVASGGKSQTDSVGYIEFPGGELIVINAGSGSALRSIPARILLLDECDAYPRDVNREGDPVNLAIQRTSTFAGKGRAKVFEVSTPTTAGASRIEESYLLGDQRQYFVPCPHCQEYQVLTWSNVKWADDPEQAWYECAHCKQAIHHHHKTAMLDRGEWRPTAKSSRAGFRSYHISSLYIPTGLGLSWGQLAVEFLAAKRTSIEQLKTFVNTKLAETWQDKGDAPEWQRLYDRCEDYPTWTAPLGVLLATAGVDVQKDRIEASVWGWGRGRESWLIDHAVFEGDPYKGDVWAKLDAYLSRPIPCAAGGTINIARIAVDTGYATHEAYDWCRKKGEIAMAVDGRHGATVPLISGAKARDIKRDGRTLKSGAMLWPVGTWQAKSELYGLIRLERNEDGSTPPGWVHLPKVGEEYCKQLVSEQFVTKKRANGTLSQEWKKTRDRNEALDCRVYARAAHAALGADRYTEAQLAELERYVARKPDTHATAPRPSNGRRTISSRYV